MDDITQAASTAVPPPSPIWGCTVDLTVTKVSQNRWRSRRHGIRDGAKVTMRKTIWDAVTWFFGPAHNERFAALLLQLADTAVGCAEHFRKTNGQDLAGIIDYEHRGDAIVDDIHELLDNSFILRFDVADCMRLTDDLDNVIDGMRKVAFHIDIYKPLHATLRPEAVEMFAVAEQMIDTVRELVVMLGSKLDLARVREKARSLDEAEATADKMLADAERTLVVEYSPAGANRLHFIAWVKLLELLEGTTDEANHCGQLIMSLARKES